MTDQEIMQWRQSIILERLFKFLGQSGFSYDKIDKVELYIDIDETDTPSITEIKVFYGDLIEPKKIPSEEFILLIFGKLTRIIKNTEDVTKKILITAKGIKSYKFEFYPK